CERVVTGTTDVKLQSWHIVDDVTISFSKPGTGAVGMALHPRRPWLATRDRQGLVTIWDVDTGQKIMSRQLSAEDILFHPNEPCLLLIGGGSSAKLWWFLHKRPLIEIRSRVEAATFNADGRYIALRTSSAVWLADSRR